jgi:PAS domain S-box-containing protein
MTERSQRAQAGAGGDMPAEAVRELQRERDHLLLLHDALMDAERASTLDERLEIFVRATARIGFGRVALTLRDGELNTVAVVAVGLSEAELRILRDEPSPGGVWCERLTSIEQFRISESYYLPGSDPLVVQSFGGGVASRLVPAPDSDWSPADALLVPLRGVAGNIVATLLLDDPSDRARPTLTRVRTVELFGRQIAAMLERASHRALAERYRLVVETSRDAIVITDHDRRIAFANPAALEFFGYGEALIGMPVELTVPPENRDLVRRREDDALAGAPQRYEGGVVRADGEQRIVAVTTAPLRELGEITGIVASLRDVTEERRARDAVVQSEARYRNLFDSATDSIYTLDLAGTFTSVNEATVRMCGHARTQLLGRSSRMLFDDDDADDLALVAREFARAVVGEAVRYESHFRRGDGERRLISVANTPIRLGKEIIGVLGVARDVTDERARIAALERSEARYTGLVESASDAIFTLTDEGRFTAVNRALEHAVGRGRNELLGAPLSSVVDASDVEAARELLRRTIEGARCRGLVRYRSASGEVRSGNVITAPVFEEGVIVGALGIMRDVTEEQRLAAQLLQQEKLAAVGQLVSGVAHELNNPLAGVMAFSELLLASRAAEEDEARRALETIHHEATRAAKIVAHLLTFARQRPAERMEADLNAIVEDTLALRRYALTAVQVELDVVLDSTLPRTWADPFQLQQVVLNLLGNAEQALTDWPGPRRIAIWTRHDGASLTLAVSDTGPGIPLEHRDRIFNPFYTTKPVGQGTGLGLSISDGIVREHGGQIRVDSYPGGGATFLVQLPIVAPLEGRAAQVAASASAAALAPAVPRRVLVVDDEPSMRAAIASFLSSLGHTVAVTQGGEEARALLATNEYDVVLLDLTMPGLGGDTFYRELCNSDPRHARRVVFVTGDTQSEHARRFLAEAGRPSLSKPFQLDDLAAVLADVMN